MSQQVCRQDSWRSGPWFRGEQLGSPCNGGSGPGSAQVTLVRVIPPLSAPSFLLPLLLLFSLPLRPPPPCTFERPQGMSSPILGLVGTSWVAPFLTQMCQEPPNVCSAQTESSGVTEAQAPLTGPGEAVPFLSPHFQALHLVLAPRVQPGTRIPARTFPVLLDLTPPSL